MKKNILFVDDDPLMLNLYVVMMEGEADRWEITTVGKAADALKILDEANYDVVVSDMRMPGMDGIQFLSQIKSMSPDTVRVMLTGNAEIETAISAINEGSIFRFLTKPCSKEMMAKTTLLLDPFEEPDIQKMIAKHKAKRAALVGAAKA